MRQGRGRGMGGEGGGVSCLMRGSVWVPVCDGIVIAGLQLDILYTLSFGLMELLFSFIVVLARHISEECILWNSDPSCKYTTTTIQVMIWSMLVPLDLDGVATECSWAAWYNTGLLINLTLKGVIFSSLFLSTECCCSCAGRQFVFVRFSLLVHKAQ